jgi:hypothetical protein
MATIDPNIAMGYRPVQIENPLNQLAAYSQIQGAQQGQQMNMLKMQEYQRGLEEENKLRTLLSGGGDINSPDVIRQMYGISPTKGLEFQQKQAVIKKAGLETTKLESEIVDNKLKQSRQFLDTIDPADPSAPARYLAWHEANHKDPVLGPMLTARGVTVNQSRANIDNAIRQGPQAFATLLNQSKIGVEKFAELNRPTIQNITRGGISEQIQTPGMGGAPVVTRTAQVTATPGELLTNAREQQRINLGERRDIVANTTTDAAGNVTQFNKFGEVINRITAAGKPSATFEKTAALKKQLNTDLTTTIKELERVTVDKGLIDQSTGSGAGRLADISAGFFGGATEGAIATAKLKPIADMVLKMVPRFEGPQSDKDTASYKEAAGQLADPTVPNKIRKEAAIEIIRLMKNRKNQFVSDVMANEGMPAGGVDTSNPLLK